MEKPREFWISQTDADDEANYAGEALFKHPRQGPLLWQSCLIHVIEKSAYDQLLADARELQKALDNWLEWEKGQIAKEGPYCGKEITQLINNGNASLETFTKKYGSAE